MRPKTVYTETEDRIAFWSAIAVILAIIGIPICIDASLASPDQMQNDVAPVWDSRNVGQ